VIWSYARDHGQEMEWPFCRQNPNPTVTVTETKYFTSLSWTRQIIV